MIVGNIVTNVSFHIGFVFIVCFYIYVASIKCELLLLTFGAQEVRCIAHCAGFVHSIFYFSCSHITLYEWPSFLLFLFTLLLLNIMITKTVQSALCFAPMKLSSVYHLQGNTPLVKAAELSNLPVTEALLSAKANVNARGNVSDKPRTRFRVQSICRAGIAQISISLFARGQTRRAIVKLCILYGVIRFE